MRRMLGTSALFLSLCAAPVLLHAQSSDQIQQAQQALKDKGFDPGPVDGLAGPKTRSAIRDFQKKQNLTADGRLGPQTLDGLGVKQAPASSNMKAAGTNLKTSYKSGGKTIGQGGKDLGHGIKSGDVVGGAKDFGKNVGSGAAKIGVGTGHAAKNAAKGVKNAVTGDKGAKTDTNK